MEFYVSTETTAPTPAYLKFSKTTLQRGLKAALLESNARYDEFEDK